MIVVTGGAGFIGSAVVWELNKRGITDILIVDHLGKSEKWHNLVSLRYKAYEDKSEFITKLETTMYDTSVEAIIHLGACSATTESDADYLMTNNVKYTERIARWWAKNTHVRLIYASSAATYGDGSRGYNDDHEQINNLRPLNMYGYSKQLFDQIALREGWLNHIVGLKYFNVFGPNEYHKDSMRSVMNKAYPILRDQGVMTLFKSYNPQYKDGEQKRDFIYVKDAVAMTLFFLDNPYIGGIYNIGTGKASTWNDVAHAMFDAVGKKPNIQYIPMPDNLKGKYQYFTEANMQKLKSVGCKHVCRSLAESVKEYIQDYLAKDAFLD